MPTNKEESSWYTNKASQRNRDRINTSSLMIASAIDMDLNSKNLFGDSSEGNRSAPIRICNHCMATDEGVGEVPIETRLWRG